MTVAEATRAAVEEKRKLRRAFRRFDIFFFLICTLVGLDTIGTVAKIGGQGFTWLVIMAVTFFVPYGLLTAELGSTFTDEGGCFVWTQRAFGDFVAAVNTVIYWVSVPVWVGGSLTISSIKAVSDFFTPMRGPWPYVFALAFIWLTIGSAVLSVSAGKWLPAAGAWARFLVVTFFTGTVILYAARIGVHGFVAREFLPSYALFIASVPVLVFNYVGFELPSSAGEEMTDPQRDVPVAVGLSAIGTMFLYGAPILAILLVLPPARVTGLGGFLDSIKAVFTVYGGHVSASGTVTLAGAGKALGAVAAGLFILSMLSSGSTWCMGANRVLAVAGYSGAAPRALGRFSARYGTPGAVNLLCGLTATIVMVLAFVLSHGDTNKYFTAVLGLAISTTTLSYLAIFPAAIRLRFVDPEKRRPYRVPWRNAGMWVCAILSTAWTLLATIALVWPGIGVGWFHTGGSPDASLPAGFTHERLQYELTQIVPLALFACVGVAFYFAGRRAAPRR